MRYVIAALMGCLTLANAQQKDYASDYDSAKILEHGNQLHNDEKFEAAIAEYERIVPIDPSYPSALYEKALTYIAMDEKDKAQAVYQQALDLGLMDDHLDLMIGYASLLSDQEKYKESEDRFKKAEKIAPEYGALLYNMALLYLRMEDKQRCVDYLKKSVMYNPQHASSHYLLGAVAFDEGRIVEGTCALAAYLMLAPTGGAADKAIVKLNQKFGENYLTRSKTVYSATGDNFEEIETILRNQLPLKDAYKVQSEFTDPAIRQLQAVAEYASTHKRQDGFFENVYFPWLADMYQRKAFEGFSYYMLASMEQQLGKKLSSQKKKVTEMAEKYMGPYLWNTFARRDLDHFGTRQSVVIYLDNGSPRLIGNSIDGKKQGKFRMVYPDNRLAGELNVKDDAMDGLQKYYDRSGKLIEETTYADGEKDGSSKSYFTNGNLKSEEQYKKGKRNGISTSYHLNGGVECQISFKDDLKDGPYSCFYEGGDKKIEGVFTKDKREGEMKKYNEVGAVIVQANYVNDELNGRYSEFFDGKTVKEDAEYAAGKVQNNYKTYFPNGTLSDEYRYENGKLRFQADFNPDGSKNYDAVYDAKGDVEKYVYYDDNGERYYEEIYKSGQIKDGIQYSRGQAKGVETDVNKKGEIIRNLDGLALVEGRYDKSRKTGEWNGKFSSGLPRYKENWKAGNRDGMKYTYFATGEPNEIMNYANDTLHGLVESYNDNKLRRVGYFTKGERNGPYTIYRKDGSMESQAYYEEGNRLRSYDYFQNGKITSYTTYINDEATTMEVYDLSGKKEQTVTYTNLSGKVSKKYHDNVSVHDFDMKNGVLHGKYLVRDLAGKTLSEGEYRNGKRNGKFVSYGVTGKPKSETYFYAGEEHGTNSYYDGAGRLRLKTTYLFGQETGKVERYYCTGAKMYDYQAYNDNADGDMIYYDHAGKPILALGFKNNSLVSCKTMDASGNLGAATPVKDMTAQIESKYPNGATAIRIAYDHNNLKGDLQINSAQGKPVYQAQYRNGKLDGNRLEYFANGQLYKKEIFVNDDYEGLSEYNREDGKPYVKITYRNDEMHGPTTIYENGKTTVKNYESDLLVSVK